MVVVPPVFFNIVGDLKLFLYYFSLNSLECQIKTLYFIINQGPNSSWAQIGSNRILSIDQFYCYKSKQSISSGMQLGEAIQKQTVKKSHYYYICESMDVC